MFSIPSTAPSTSILLSGVPHGFTEDDVRALFKDLPEPEVVVFQKLGDSLFLNCATCIFRDMKAVQDVTLRLLGKVIGNGMSISYCFRPFDCSPTREPGKMNMRAPLDDRGFPKDPYETGNYQYDWKEVAEFPDIPNGSSCVSLRWNLITRLQQKRGFDSVTTLYLRGNNIEAIDEGVSFCNVTYVDLSFNRLKKLPDLSQFCPRVTSFDASHNRIREIHEGIVKLKELRVLVLSFNEIESVPALPSSLENLSLSHCPIREIANCELELSKLEIHHTNLEKLPNFVGQVIQEKMVVGCHLTAVPLVNLANNIAELSLRGNNIKIVPPELFALPTLTVLSLCHNKIHKIPDTFTTSKLRSFDISENPISELPVIPDTLIELNISLCHFEDICGFIPNDNRLVSLHATGNNLTKLPELKGIELLLVAGNALTVFPPLKLDCPVPMTISFAWNKLEQLPDDNRSKFLVLDLSHNRLTSIPHCYFTSAKESLKLDGNPIEQIISADLMANIDSIDCLNTKITIEGSCSPLIREIVTNEPLPKPTSFSERTTPAVENAVYILPRGLAYSETIGGRVDMEDALIIRDEIFENVALITVFDGHGGRKAARLAAASFPEILAKKQSYDVEAIADLVQEFNNKLISINEVSGSTMEMIFINKKDRTADVYHLGDARCVMFDENATCIFTTEDHRPENRAELERLRELKIALRSMKAAGRLGTSGALGDVQYPGMRLIPEHFKVDIGDKCRWIVLACDGLFDELTNEDVGRTVLRYGYERSAVILRDQAYSRGSTDNISVIVIDVKEMLS